MILLVWMLPSLPCLVSQTEVFFIRKTIYTHLERRTFNWAESRRGIKNSYTQRTNKNTDLDLLEIKESGNNTYEIFLRGSGRKGEIVFTK